MLDKAPKRADRAALVAELPDFSGFDPSVAESEVGDLLAACRAAIERHADGASDEDWGLVAEEEERNDALDRYWSVLSHLHAVADTAELRAAYNACLAMLTSHYSWRQHHEGLHAAYLRLKNGKAFENLAPGKRRLVELELRDFHLAGVDLAQDDKAEYRDLVQRLSDLGARFGQNLLDATQGWDLHIDDGGRLAGLPESELNMLSGLARHKGMDGWLVNLSYPAYTAVMKHAEDRELRHQVYAAYSTRASDQGPQAGQWDNSPLVNEILGLRHRLAQLLGFEQYVDFALATRMAEDHDTVYAFLQELARRARPVAQEQLSELTDFAAAEGAPTPLQAWDIAFWSERLRKRELDLSDEILKPYFPLENMLGALREVVHRLFGVRMVRDPQVDTWHHDVRFYWLEDESGTRFAGAYLDLHVRAFKRDGAWVGTCQSRRVTRDGVQMPIAFLTCNFRPEVEGQPSLLTPEDVRTLFHEAGHCFHHLLTTVDLPQINGMNNVEWDAVELPSQLFEAWTWEDELLAKYARHYKTNEELPQDLRARMKRARYFQKALALMRQIKFAMVDLRLHSEYDPTSPPDPLQVMEEVRAEFGVVPVPKENRFLNTFGHIFGGGYSAGYYSYLWAEELAADAWGRFREEGAFSRSVGIALRDEVLAVGASRPAMESFTAFRGRAPEPGPLLESYGLEP